MSQSSSASAPKIGFVCASLRSGSINKTLEGALRKRFKAAGAKTSIIDLAKYDMPIFNGDLDRPASVKKLITRMKGFDGIVIVTPEYNGCLPPLLKNAIDWTSTVTTDHISGPVYGIASCTPGPMSGIMCLRQLNFILMRLGGEVVPTHLGCGLAGQAFDHKGNLVRENTLGMADKMRDQMLMRIARKG